MSDQDPAPPPHGTTPPPFRGTPPPQPGPPRPQYSPPGAPQYSPPGAPQYSPPGAPQYSPPGSHDPSSGVPQHPSPGWPVPPQPVHRPAPKRTGLWILLGALALLLLVSSAVVGWWASGWGDRHPDEWDPAVAELAEFLEEERDVDFDHPVFVNFLDADEYRAAAGAEPSDGAALDDGSDG